MSTTPNVLYRGRPNTSVQTLYTNPNTAGVRTIVRTILVANNTSLPAVISFWTVPTGGSNDDTNIIVPELTVAAKGFNVLELIAVLGQNESLRALQGTLNALTVTVSGVLIEPPVG
jgi:hypothetical protein